MHIVNTIINKLIKIFTTVLIIKKTSIIRKFISMICEMFIKSINHSIFIITTMTIIKTTILSISMKRHLIIRTIYFLSISKFISLINQSKHKTSSTSAMISNRNRNRNLRLFVVDAMFFFYFNNKLHKHVKQCKIVSMKDFHIFDTNVFIIEFKVLKNNDVDYVFRQ